MTIIHNNYYVLHSTEKTVIPTLTGILSGRF